MKKTIQFFSLLFIIFQAQPIYAWNSLGHRLIAEIAFENMTPEARKKALTYNNIVNQKYKTHLNFNMASVWLDWQNGGFERHYINLPFSYDHTKLKPPNKTNALTTIDESLVNLKNDNLSPFQKGINLRVLLHVVADIHQPLHTVTQYSKVLPNGDKGGNLYRLKHNNIAKNLHAYWDRGAGFLLTKKRYSQKKLKKRADLILRRYPCEANKMSVNPHLWVQESFKLAEKSAYPNSPKIDKDFQRKVKRMTEQRIALAGCRLAKLLNSVF